MLLGCSNKNLKTEVTQKNNTIPSEYLVKCSVPVFTGNTDSELATKYIQALNAIERCNKQLEFIRDFKDF